MSKYILILSSVLFSNCSTKQNEASSFKKDTLLRTADTTSVTIKNTDTINKQMSWDTPNKVIPIKDLPDTVIVDYLGNMPEFPGGEIAFEKFIQKNLIYPVEASDKELKGIVYIGCIIEKDGTVSNIKSIHPTGRGLVKGIEITDIAFVEAAIDAISKSPRWKPGMHGGKKYRVREIIPVRFNYKVLQSEENL